MKDFQDEQEPLWVRAVCGALMLVLLIGITNLLFSVIALLVGP